MTPTQTALTKQLDSLMEKMGVGNELKEITSHPNGNWSMKSGDMTVTAPSVESCLIAWIGFCKEILRMKGKSFTDA